ncbi:7TM GPCR protein [Aphelenchoides avenae]|nr:7TM GPCR protein [Aphelenchus avenae]
MLSIGCYLVLILIVARKSPRAMGAYRWYIIFNSTSCMIFELVYGLSHPEPLYPYTIFIVGGLLKNVQLPAAFIVCYVDLLMFCMCAVIISTALLFAFRYSQTVDGWPHRAMSSRRIAIPLVLAIFVVVFGTICVPQHFAVKTHDEIMLDMANNTELLPVIDGRNVFAFRVSHIANNAGTVLFITVVAVIVLSTFGCYYFLRKNVRMLSKRTKELYQRLVNALLIDLGICFLLIFLPFCVMMMFYVAGSDYTSIVYSCSFATATLYQVVTHVFLLTYITPYRQAVINVYMRATGRSAQESTWHSSPSITRSRRLFGPRSSIK